MAWFSSAGAVGLEIDTGVIRAVEIKGSEQAASITTVGEIQIPEQAVVEGVVTDVTAVTHALSELWAKGGFSKRNIVLGLCNQGVFMRMTTFPKIPEKKLPQALRFQAGDHFPVDLAQLIFDFSVVGETSDHLKQMEILLVASRRDMVETFLRTLQDAKLQPSVIDVTYLSLLRTLSQTQKEETIVVADIANGLTSIQVVSQGIPRFSRVIPHSLKTYAREFQIPLLEDTMLAKPQVAMDQDTLPAFSGLVVEDWFSNLANEIRSTVSYYLAQSNAHNVDTVILAGRGAALLPSLQQRLQEDLGVTVEILDPLKNLGKTLKVETSELTGVRPDYAVSIGLALRGLEG